MKIISLFSVILLVTVVMGEESDIDRIRAHSKIVIAECKQRTNASDDDVREMLNHTPSSTRVGKCFRACVMREFGILNRNGKLHKRQNLRLLSVVLRGGEARLKTAEEMIDVCRRIRVPKDICESAHRYGTCLAEEYRKRQIPSVWI